MCVVNWMATSVHDLFIDGKAVVNASRQYKQVAGLDTNAHL